jgi:hypothetical protein
MIPFNATVLWAFLMGQLSIVGVVLLILLITMIWKTNG